ncbi:RsmF rRNA methyltransferase first C-terminal domain-containing protein [Lacticaseibacillus baoqingensis]|uniref:RsmF rRNA methyltransferase first C-terminal domain-containing protein n=1 Tax=Lacticaseibacillus baoqingensis TaxID=2486013 RepID=A0ABW4EB54_9LACO|nr:RsmF rRNA methyltransferase first C-terminal domain-containing protein [Lacticaseibacillus baoqingensis]
MDFPEGFKTKYQRLLGAEAPAFFATFQQPAETGYRINPLKPAAPLALGGPAIPWSTWGHYGKVAGNDIEHVSGFVYSQEPSAQFVATVLAPEPGERVLDLCAAPGGKTTHIASFMGASGLIVTNEINRSRAKILASNVERFGITNALITNNDPDSLAAAWPEAFDKILVDAPCSGEGMFRKDPDAMQYWTPDYPAACAQRQREILVMAEKMLRPGGVLVYSTCTFSPEEDEQIAAWANAELPLTLVPIQKPAGIASGRPKWADNDPAVANTARLWPHQLRGEGHFVARFVKAGQASVKRYDPQWGRLSATQRRDFDTFVKANLTQMPSGHLLAVKDQLFAVPETALDWRHVRIVRAGLHLGTFKKNRFEPSHSLATALPPAAFQQVVKVSQAEYLRYRHGELLPSALSGKHYVLLTCEDKGFAIGKLVNQTIKNLYPKGLRH